MDDEKYRVYLNEAFAKFGSTMDACHVTILNTSFIRPASPTPRHFMYLSSLDLFWREVPYNKRILFYQMLPAHYVAALHRLKQALSETLPHFYPWAGRLAVNNQDNGRIAVDCNDHGVEFVEASTDFSFTHLEDNGFHINAAFFDAFVRHSSTDIFGTPLLSIQVSQFCNGGMAVGIAHSHVICDGHSFWHFMNSWAELGKGLPISSPPLHNRTFFKVDEPSPQVACLRFLSPMDENEESSEERKQKLEVLVQRSFLFTQGMIKKLKERTFEEGQIVMQYTSYEVLCAHFWRHVIRARKLEKETIVCFMVLVNSRNRLLEPLPAAYFGNVVQFQVASGKAGEIMKENFAATLQRIHEAIIKCTETTLWEIIHWLELHDNLMLLEILKAFRDKDSMRVASSPRFPLYEVDFGWGRPSWVIPARVMGNGEMVIDPGRKREGSVSIWMPLTADSMERLEKDPDFIYFM